MAHWEFERGGVLNALIDLPLRGFFGLFGLLPHGVSLALAGWISAYILAPIFGINKRIRHNLRLIYPDMPTARIDSLCREISGNSARWMLESFNTAGFVAHAENATLSGPGKSTLLKALAENRPVVLVSGHFGNFQVLRVQLAQLGYATAAIYRPMNNAHTNRRYVKGMNMIAGPNFPRGMAGTKALLGHLRRGGAIALLNDQFAREGKPLSFMGQPALTMLSAAEFALKYTALLIPCYGIRQPNGVDFKAIVELPIPVGTSVSMTQALNNSLEAMVRAYPAQWFWIHNRWKNPD
jgi:Kdo2-lipid IVA lauroyltransferase/acyltransferase